MSSSKNLESAAKHKSKVHQETVVEEEVNDEEVTMLFPQIITKEDVINNFFNQMVQLVITDMIVLEQENNNKDKKEETTSESNIIVKDYKDLKASDLNKSEIISVKGSKVTLKQISNSTRDGWDKNKNSPANLKKDKTLSKTATIKEESLEKLSKTPSTETVSSFKDLFLMDDEREVKIFFTNGNIYEGQIAKCIMNGKGKYYWTDGTVYEGDFKDGFPTGNGVMTLPDLSHYEGDFNEGLFEGEGFLNIVSTPTFYSGQWKDGLRNGHGWLLHKPGQWYEGAWLNDYKHGFGVRFYKNRANKYRGNWREGKFDGEGIMIWPNNDFYKGEWKGGKMDGYGEYIWQAFYNKAFAFPIQNTYRGLWKDGKRHGDGVMNFGDDSGAKLKGNWCQDFKDGYGRLYCGNGKIIEEENLFQNDKPVLQTSFSMLTPNEDFLRHIREIPIFTMPESVDVSFYIKKILKNIEEVNEEKVKLVQKFEENSVKNIIIIFLPQLNELYHHYATLGTKEELNYKPVLIRLFLWKLFQDIEIHNLGLSLVDADNILAENPQSCVESTYHPFEPIYFWQFLMSLIGIALTTTSLDDVLDSDSSQGVSAIIIKKFFEEIFAKPLDRKGSNLFTYMDLVPINSVYSLYQQLGEPHTAKTFLRHTCRRKGEVPVLCYMEMHPKEYVAKAGTNFTALAEHVFFMNQNWNPKLEGSAHKWTSLYDFWRLGPRNVVRCLSKNCPLIVVEGRVVNMEYPLTFLEFYETLLDCIFLILDLEMKKEKILLQQMVVPPAEPVPQKTRTSEKSADTDKKSQKTGKKGKKRKSKDKLP